MVGVVNRVGLVGPCVARANSRVFSDETVGAE
jgi:hypothetical protein